jgi:hypothetical protein
MVNANEPMAILLPYGEGGERGSQRPTGEFALVDATR